eukprot:6212045-Pleurochrysis_carterae.AAC.1
MATTILSGVRLRKHTSTQVHTNGSAHERKHSQISTRTHTHARVEQLENGNQEKLFIFNSSASTAPVLKQVVGLCERAYF